MGTVAEPMTSLVPGLATSSIVRIAEPFGTASTSSLVANLRGVLIRLSACSWSGSLVLAAA